MKDYTITKYEHIKNVQHLLTMLDKVSKDVADQLRGPMIQGGAKFFEEKAKGYCPVKTGNLKRSITTKKISGTDKANPSYVVTLLRNAKRTVRVGGEKKRIAVDGWYAHLVEFGTDPHPEPKKKKAKIMKIEPGEPGFVKKLPEGHPGTGAQPFFRPAFSHHEQAIGAMAKTLEKRMRKYGVQTA